ncbi:nuclear transport factor 2 family protein [Aquimarina sp. BL5]|uniref:nuclear transport factor 2 family protein n=1 Tax=Aquimarina sp. BL5 TaxID=1714860 RepID=UPI000E541007|nr:nuclear transport factor 2 family protein [Aquimarina sp. BL5]AXT49695.1 nuclear transport factor 2 family protein [Aquimarina sp. BL5]RKM96804.1 nuclear transport factor 2 family protein [Aquimarina sp. BL5]
MKNSQDVFESHMKAVDTLNASNVAEDYSDDALFITPEKTYKGKSEILEFYTEFLPNFEDFQFNTIKQETNGKVVYFVWNGKNKHIDLRLATDTYIIENGKIKQHTFASVNN